MSLYVDCASATESSHDDYGDDELPFALAELAAKEDEKAAVPARAPSLVSSATPPVTSAPAVSARPSFVFGKVVHDSPDRLLTTPPKESSRSVLLLNGQASQLSSNSLPPQMVTSSIMSSPTTVDSETTHHQSFSSACSYNGNSSSLLLPSVDYCSSHYLDAAASLLLPHHGSILARSSRNSTTSSTSVSGAHDSTTLLNDYQSNSVAQSDTDNNDSNNGLSHAQSMAFSQLLHQAGSSNPKVATSTHHAAPRSCGALSTAYLPPVLEEASFAAATSSSSAFSSSYFTLPDAYSSYQEPGLQEHPHGIATTAAVTDHDNIRDRYDDDGGTGDCGHWFSRNPFSLSPGVVPYDQLSPLQQKEQQQLQQTIVPEASDASILREHKRQQHRLRQQQQLQRNADGGVAGPRHLASLAGATARMTGELSFDVSIDLVVPSCTILDVMDVVGNPDMLHLWCDAVSSLVITSISEGAQDAVNRRRRLRCDVALTEQDNNIQQQHDHESSNREYQGEWIEATTAQLMAPVNSLSCLYSTSRMLAVAMGFPTYGKISMFVERHRGHVGLTMGPLPGGYEILHRIKVESITGVDRRIRLTDQVRLQKDSNRTGETNVNFCGVFSVLERCFLPTPEDYMDQVLNSMARLRFLVENGEETDRVIPHHHRFQGGQNGDSNDLTAPLISA